VHARGHTCLQNTLWLESYKLYGHGDSLHAAAASPDGALLASACVAKSPAAAVIWVWDVAGRTWRGVAQLQARFPCFQGMGMGDRVHVLT
jgi:elongator complex protein 2